MDSRLRGNDSHRVFFILLGPLSIMPQSYGCKPVDEDVRQRRTGEACCCKCYGRKPVEIYLDRFLHYGPFCGPSVEIT